MFPHGQASRASDKLCDDPSMVVAIEPRVGNVGLFPQPDRLLELRLAPADGA